MTSTMIRHLLQLAILGMPFVLPGDATRGQVVFLRLGEHHYPELEKRMKAEIQQKQTRQCSLIFQESSTKTDLTKT